MWQLSKFGGQRKARQLSQNTAPSVVRAYLCVEDLDGVQAAGDLHEGRVQEIALELLRLQGRTHDHQLQVRALLQHLARASGNS